jgi:coenzyme F420-dependent glucose-6-phosphate dehydrogenase
MAVLGYMLSSEEHPAGDLVANAIAAEHAGFAYAVISDHFHPWISAQGHSPFAWSVLGAIACQTSRLHIGTAVTCPTMRYHPAVIAQAAATLATMAPGRFILGLGTGENLNEHVVGHEWPRHEIRAAMLEEAVEIMRRLWTGKQCNFVGQHFRVDNARLYGCPHEPPPIVMAAAGPHAAELAGRVGDGLMNYSADAAVVEKFHASGGNSKPCYLQVNVCWARTEQEARATAMKQVPNVALPGELGNLLPSPKHYEQAASLVTEDALAQMIVCGPDPQAHVARLQEAIDAGYDHLHIAQVGPDQAGFFAFYQREVLPHFAA